VQVHSLPTMTVLRRLVDNMLDRLYVPTVHAVCPHRHHARRTCPAPACDQYHSLPFSSFAREHYPHRSPIPSTSRPSSAHWHNRSRTSTRAHDLAVPTPLHLAPLTMEMMPVLTPLLTLVVALTWKVLVETPFRRKSSIHTRFFTSLEVLQG
jgi:hypothetical protein